MTEPLPMLEAVAETLAQMDERLPDYHLCKDVGWMGKHSSFPSIFAGYNQNAETFARLLALRGWRLVPVGVVNADEVVK